MPLYKNNQPSSISINNSFSSRVSGDYINFEKGLIYSNTGIPFLNSGQKVDVDDYDLTIKINSYLIATGSSFLKSRGPEGEDKNNHSFYIKAASKSQSYLDGDFFIFKNSGENPNFNCYLSKNSGHFLLSISNGFINSKPIEENGSFYSLKIDKKQKGQLIFYAKYSSESQSVSIDFSETITKNNQSFFERDPENDLEHWEVEEYVSRIPICFVDFDRESVVSFFESNVSTSTNGSSLGIDGKGYPLLS